MFRPRIGKPFHWHSRCLNDSVAQPHEDQADSLMSELRHVCPRLLKPPQRRSEQSTDIVARGSGGARALCSLMSEQLDIAPSRMRIFKMVVLLVSALHLSACFFWRVKVST